MNLLFDLKYAVRLALKSPGYFVLCTLIVALSVGLALWAWVLVYTLALKPLEFPGSERWLNIQMAANATASSSPEMDAYTYQEVLKRSRSVDHLGAFSQQQVVLSEGRSSTRLRAAAISPQLLAALRVPSLSGRLFDAIDAERGAAPVAILSYNTWRSYFAGDSAVIGRQARIDGRPVQIIGVMPERFFAFQDFEILLPLRLDPIGSPAESKLTVSAFVVLKPGQAAAAAAGEIAPAVAEVNRNHPTVFNAARHAELVPANVMFTHGFMPVATMISFVAAAVLLLGCVNVSLVFFARLLERSRELALRVALGSSRWRLLRQCLIESMLVMIPGLLLGVGLTELGVRWTRGISDFLTQYLANGRDGDPLTVRGFDLLVAVALAGTLWLLSTLLPSWRIARQDAVVSLNGSGKGVAQTGRARSAGIVVGLQVVVSCLVLVVCVNLLSAVNEEASRPTGIRSAGVMLSTYPTAFGPRQADGPARLSYWDQLAAQVRERVPGAEVAFATAVPTRPMAVPAAIENQQRAADQGTLKLPVTAVSDNYFQLLGISLRAGRSFDSSDREGGTATAVVDEVTARRYWPNQEALGRRIQLDPGEGGPWLTVVGVVSAVGHEPYGDNRGVVYRSLRQASPGQFLLIARLPDAAPERRAALQAAAFAIDPDLPLHNLQTLDNFLAALDLTYTALVPAFGVISAITVLLAASGLFGLISRSAARRTQEIGVRRALGSSPARILWLFLRQGAVHLGAGLVGGALGLIVADQISQAIPNVLTHAPLITAGVFLLLASVIFLATYLPTRRAVALEPAEALRYE